MNTSIQTTGTTTINIDGMTCGHCVQAVTKALSAVPGVTVKSVAVGSAVIEAKDEWAADNAVAALEEAGYPAKAIGDTAVTAATMPAKGGGGCCGGAKSAMPSNTAAKGNAGGCCG